MSEEKTELKLFRKDFWNVWMTKNGCRIRPDLPLCTASSDDPVYANTVTLSKTLVHTVNPSYIPQPSWPLLLAMSRALLLLILSHFLFLFSVVFAQSSASSNSTGTPTSSGSIPHVTGINASLPLCAVVRHPSIFPNA
jgi:hypothetical protein